MQLSEAIRLGSMLKPQAFRHALSAETVSSCALQAAAEAIGIPNSHAIYSPLQARWPFTRLTVVCPACGGACRDAATTDVIDVIWRLNDCHRWTRERIADWVATVEAAQALAAAPATNAVDPQADVLESCHRT